MNLVIIVLFLLGGAQLLWGRKIERNAASADEGIAAVIPYLLGIACWAIAGVLIVGYVLFQAFT